MMLANLLSVLLLVGLLWVLAFLRCPLFFCLFSFAVLFLFLGMVHWLGMLMLCLFWLMWLMVAVLYVVSPLRRKYIILPLLNWFHAQQPSLSLVEQQVLAAGEMGWEGCLFTGQPNWQHLLNQKKLLFTSAEQAFLNNQVEALCYLLDESQFEDHDRDLPASVWHYIKQERFWGLVISPQYGGHGFSPLAHSAIIDKIASRSYSAAVSVMVPNSLGPGEFLQHFGTEEQKNYYLPKLVRGEEIPCFALTSPDAGSDAGSITDEGIICQGEFQGKQIIGIRLNWQKRYITLGPITTLIGLVFHLYDPQHLLGDKIDVGITVALVPADCQGVIRGKRHKPLGLALMNGPIEGNNVFIPLDWIIGGVEKRGQGWQMLMECLALGRGISLLSVSTAAASVSFLSAGAYALIRQQFHRSIGAFEGIQAVLARIGGLTYLCEATRLLTLHAVQAGKRPSVGSAIAKYHLTELSRKIVNDAMDVHGGRGIQLGPRNYLAFFLQGASVNVTVEGANILTRCLIIFGQGVVRCHPYLADELVLATELDFKKQLRRADQVFLGHLGFSLNQVAKMIGYGLSHGRGIASPRGGWIAYYYQQLTRMSTVFIVLCDVSLLFFAKQLKVKEFVSARLGDSLSYLYMGSAVLKYYEDHGQLDEERPLVAWALDYCLHEIQTAVDQFLANFPARGIAFLLGLFISPWKKKYHFPSDSLAQKVANHLLEENSLRHRFSRNCYVGEKSALWRVENGMRHLLKNRSLLEKIKLSLSPFSTLKERIEEMRNVSKINDQEYEELKKMADACWDAILVDEFDSI